MTEGGRLRLFVRRLRPAALLRAAAGAAACVLLAGASGGAAQTPGGLTVQLRQGWNNVPYYGPEAAPDVALASIGGKYNAVWYWDAVRQRYLSHTTDSTTASDLTSMVAGRSYWIVANDDATLTLAAPTPGSVPALAPGWNNFVHTGARLPVERALAFLHGRYSDLYVWDTAEQRFRGINSSDTGGPAWLEPYTCYWLRFT